MIPLLQATDFVPRLAPGAQSAPREAVFVGSTHEERTRQLVLQAVDARVPLAVYGRG